MYPNIPIEIIPARVHLGQILYISLFVPWSMETRVFDHLFPVYAASPVPRLRLGVIKVPKGSVGHKRVECIMQENLRGIHGRPTKGLVINALKDAVNHSAVTGGYPGFSRGSRSGTVRMILRICKKQRLRQQHEP